VRRSLIGSYSALYADLEGDGIDLPAGYSYVVGDSIAGMHLLTSSGFAPGRADTILISVSGGTEAPPEQTTRSTATPIDRTGLGTHDLRPGTGDIDWEAVD